MTDFIAPMMYKIWEYDTRTKEEHEAVVSLMALRERYLIQWLEVFKAIQPLEKKQTVTIQLNQYVEVKIARMT